MVSLKLAKSRCQGSIGFTETRLQCRPATERERRVAPRVADRLTTQPCAADILASQAMT